MTGGKLTTYRKMAQDTVDAVVPLLGPRPDGPGVAQAHHALAALGHQGPKLHGAGSRDHAPAASSPDTTFKDPDAATRVAAHLAGRYGTETPGRPGSHRRPSRAARAARAGAPLPGRRGPLRRPLRDGPDADDVLDRRTRAVLHDAWATAESAHRVAALIAPELGWTDDHASAEAEAYAASVRAVLVRAGLDTDVVSAASAGPASERVPDGGPQSREDRR